MSEIERLLSHSSSNPMGVHEEMVKRGAEELLADYASEYVADHLSWKDFAGQALRVLNAGLRGTVWEDR
ncbi:hypothetical protein [Actinophytocola sediminis]